MSDPTKDNEREITRLRESSLAEELIASRKELLECHEALLRPYEMIEALLGLLQVDYDSDEGYESAWRFLRKLEEANHAASVALSEVVLEWIRNCAVKETQEDILRAVEVLITQLSKKSPETTVRVQ